MIASETAWSESPKCVSRGETLHSATACFVGWGGVGWGEWGTMLHKLGGLEVDFEAWDDRRRMHQCRKARHGTRPAHAYA